MREEKGMSGRKRAGSQVGGSCFPWESGSGRKWAFLSFLSVFPLLSVIRERATRYKEKREGEKKKTAEQ